MMKTTKRNLSQTALQAFPVTLLIADKKSSWESIGFLVDSKNEVHFNEVSIKLCGDEPEKYKIPSHGGIFAWNWSGISNSLETIDGIPILRDKGEGSSKPDTPALDHPNGVNGIDHIVLNSFNFEKTEKEMENLGVQLRQKFSPGNLNMAFYRPRTMTIEVLANKADKPEETQEKKSFLWGITFATKDISATHTYLKDLTKPPHDAVQKGRKFMTLQKTPLISTKIGFISPYLKKEK
jgi:hypothetical protein